MEKRMYVLENEEVIRYNVSINGNYLSCIKGNIDIWYKDKLTEGKKHPLSKVCDEILTSSNPLIVGLEIAEIIEWFFGGKVEQTFCHQVLNTMTFTKDKTVVDKNFHPINRDLRNFLMSISSKDEENNEMQLSERLNTLKMAVMEYLLDEAQILTLTKNREK